MRPTILPALAAALCATLLLAGWSPAVEGAAAASARSRYGPARAGVPLEQPTGTSLPSDAVDVRVAMTENDTSMLVVTSAGGVVAPGVVGARAVTFTPVGGGTWTVSTGTGCAGPWTEVQEPPVATPSARPATAGDLLTLCADNGTQLPLQGTVSGVYNSAGQARTVSTLPLEDYVADVVPGESPSYWGTAGGPGPQSHPWGFQELEAQAVAVRSYVLASPGGYGGYATTCDLSCQTYRGARYLSANSSAAAQDTAGEVMVMPGGAIATTEYSASTGGYTSSSAEGSPFTPVPDAGDAVCPTPPPSGFAPGALCNPNHDWSVTVALSTLHAHWPQEGTTPTVAVSGRNGYGTWGGRVTELTISGNGTSQTVGAGTFVGALGLDSNYFTITSPAGQPLQVTGHGWGHGVGMGQWGAFGYAIGTDGGQGNWTWQRIVSHYYAPATLEQLPATAGTFTTFTRLAGSTADGTAAAELEDRFDASAGDCPGTPSARPVVLATDANYPDALASAPLARYLGTGTLLTPGTGLSPAARTALRVEGVTSVYVVGGPLAVSTAVIRQLEATPAYACGGASPLGSTISVSRIWGQTQYTTAQDIAETAARGGVGSLDLSRAYAGTDATGGEGRYNDTAGSASGGPAGAGPLATAIVASGQEFQDAEAASTLAYADRLPVLLTTQGALSPQAASAISSLHVRQVIVLGGQLAVSDAVVTSLEHLGVSVLRVAGGDFTDTAVQLARLETAASPTGAGWQGTGDLTVARGDFFTDGLAGAVVAAAGPASGSPEPLLLTESPTLVGGALAAFLQAAGRTGVGGRKVTHLTVLGGPLALTQTTVDAMGSDL